MALLILLLVFLEVYFWLLLLTRFHRRRQYLSFSNFHNCSLPPYIPSKSKFLHKFHLLRQDYGNLFNDYYHSRFQSYGPTHAIYNKSGIPAVAHTIDPANLHAVTVTKHEDFVVIKTRRSALYPLAQEGLITTDGEVWKGNRRFLAREFNNRSVKETLSHERGMDLFFEAIDEENRAKEAEIDGEGIDVTGFLRRMTLDRSSKVLFGLDPGLQRLHMGRRQKRRDSVMDEAVPAMDDGFMLAFTETWETIREYVTWRSALGSKYWLADGFNPASQYRRACASFRKFFSSLIEKAKQQDTNDRSAESVLQKLLKEHKDPVHIREILIELVIASQNMTATLLSFAIAELAANPEVYSRLRTEILSKFGPSNTTMSYSALKTCRTLQAILSETLRMHPITPILSKTAIRPTIFPSGGGPSSKDHTAISKGATVTINLYVLQRECSDGWKWDPSRWIDSEVSPAGEGIYAPFSSGPRASLGKTTSLTEMSYFLARFAQRYESVEPAPGSKNEEQEYRSILSPKHGVKVVLS